jgi:hypothetical protein
MDAMASVGFKSGTGIIELLVSLKIPKFASERAARRANVEMGTPALEPSAL